MPWAPVTSPEAIIALTCSFCWAVNWTPALDSEVMPFTGSLRALPSCMLALLASPPSTAAMSNASPVALSNSFAGHFRERQEHRLGLNDLLSVDTDLHFHLVGHRRELADGLPRRSPGRLDLLLHAGQRAVHRLRAESALLDPIERFHAEAEAEQWTGYLADPFESAGELLTEPLGGNLPAVGLPAPPMVEVMSLPRPLVLAWILT